MLKNGWKKSWWPLLALLFLMSFASCRESGQRNLILGAYTAPREAFREINRAFENQWKEQTGETIKVRESYLSSGAQSRAVVDGFQADVVALALETDVDRIAEADLIEGNWREAPHGGILTRSVVAFAVRPGNPKGIQDWADLLKPGLEVLTPNPRTSGGAQWNVLAAYGAVLRGKVKGFSANEEGAKNYLRQLLGRVTAMDKGARESILTFERGLGDVALSYENEIREGQAHGNDYELIMPPSTILIENPVAIVEKNSRRHGNQDLVQAYFAFLFSPVAQKIFMAHGFRPVMSELMGKNQVVFPEINDLFTIQLFGGWKKALPEYFGEGGIFTLTAEQAQEKGASDSGLGIGH